MTVFKANRPFWLMVFSGAYFFNTTAQTHYTLQDILSIGAKKGTRIKIIENKAMADKQQAQMYLSEALPQIGLSTSFDYSNQSQLGTQLTSTNVSIFDRIDGLLFNWSISIQQPLIDFGNIFNSFKLATLGMDILTQNRLLQRNLYFLDIIQPFIQSYMYQYEYTISLQSLAHSRRLMNKMQLDFEYNQTSRIDLLRTKAAFENNNADSIKARTNKEIARQKLNLLIGLDDSTVYELVLDPSSMQYEQNVNDSFVNLEIRLKTLETKVNELLRRNTWAAMLPKLNLTVSLNNEFFIIDTT
ncbi:MAG TPA: TolC family protein, partial [Chitinispirillaceae bacterium]|nr:TolC family protein [Chitinispirillaceae bacterium]